MSGAAQQQAQLVPTHSYLESRALAVESVQSTIVELGGIFDQLRVMVAEQGSEMQRVDENVDDALSNVEQPPAAAALAPRELEPGAHDPRLRRAHVLCRAVRHRDVA